MWPLKKKEEWDGSERRNPERLENLRMQNLTRIFRISNLRKRLLIYFFLIIFVTFSVGLQLIFEVGSPRLKEQISHSISSQYEDQEAAEPDMAGVGTILTRLQHRMMLIMGIVLVCVVATMFVFIRNIVEPLDAMGKAARRITEGHLDETVPIRCQDEIGKIGELINDLAINLQEVLLHVWNHTCQDIVLMDHIAEIIHAQPVDIMPDKVKEKFDFVRKDIEEMQEIVKAFDYYNIRFEGDSLISGDSETSEAVAVSVEDENDREKTGSAGDDLTSETPKTGPV